MMQITHIISPRYIAYLFLAIVGIFGLILGCCYLFKSHHPPPLLETKMLGSENEFFLFIPSNSSLDYYPESTLTSFQVKLPHPITLIGQYEVGLKELHYPHNWEMGNIELSEPEDEMAMLIYDRTTLAPHPDRHTLSCVAGKKTYDSLDILLRCINDEIQTRRRNTNSTDPFYTTKKDMPRMEYDKTLGRFVIYNDVSSGLKYVKLHLSEKLAKRFGFEPDQFRLDVNKVEPAVYAKHIIRKARHTFDYLYVYTDIIQSSVVGNTVAPLLRIVGVKGEEGDTISFIFEEALYFKLLKNTFDSVQIKIRDDTGRPIPFQSQGRTIAVLHFRKI
jgi:hypothetical protein